MYSRTTVVLQYDYSMIEPSSSTVRESVRSFAVNADVHTVEHTGIQYVPGTYDVWATGTVCTVFQYVHSYPTVRLCTVVVHYLRICSSTDVHVVGISPRDVNQ
jgi:hypothetical protein